MEGGPPSFTRSSTSSVLLWYAENNGEYSLLRTGLSPSTAPHLKCLTLPQTVTRRLIMQKARGHPFSTRRLNIGLPQLVGIWFQVLLTPLIGVLFIVQSPYFALSVVEKYLALEGGPPSFTQSSTSSVLLWYTDITQTPAFAYRTITFYGRTFQTVPLAITL